MGGSTYAPNNEWKSITKFLKKNMLSKFDTARSIISDGGSKFCNKMFKGLLEKHGVRHNQAILTTYRLVGKLMCPIERSNRFW